MYISTFQLVQLEVSGQLHTPANLPSGKSTRYPLARRLSGPQNRSGVFGEEKILDPTGTRTPTPKPLAIPTALSRLRLVMWATNYSVIHEKIKLRLNLVNACCHPVQNLLFSRLLSENGKIKLYYIITFLVVFYGCGTWSLILREDHRLTVFEILVLRRVFVPKWVEIIQGW
jgi:hypothetical protein